MQQQYSRFEFREFGKEGVIYTPQKNETEALKERIIDDVIATHYMEDSKNPEDMLLIHNEPKLEINIEEIREESYKNGYNDAKAHYEPIVSKIKEDDSLAELLKQKLDSIIPVDKLEDELFRLSTSMALALAKKMHLVIPTDFETIILGEMLAVLNKYYKAGNITLKVNPDKKDHCQNLLKIASLPERIAKNLSIENDETIGKNDCKIEWHDTELQYNQEEIMLNAEKILEHLKMENNN